jgi:hypothetical protein
MSKQVTITYNGASRTVNSAVAESQIAKAEQAITLLRDKMAARHAAHAAKPITSDREQVDADRQTMADIARYDSIIAACRNALGA